MPQPDYPSSLFGAPAAAHCLEDLYLFAVLFNQMADEDDAAATGVGVILVLGCGERIARPHPGFTLFSIIGYLRWSGPRGVSPPPGLLTLSTT
jgi:hypothetical protein